MILTGATKEQIEFALKQTNNKYDNNIIFRNFEPMSKSGKRFRVTLRVENSKKSGHRVSFSGVPYGRKPRRLPCACWHVHGNFFQWLPPDTKITTVINKGIARDYQFSCDWPDRNIGSQAFPKMASCSCDCEK